MKNSDIKRYLSTLIILLVIFPPIFITRYAGEPGAYVGLFIFALISLFAVWELLTMFGYNKYVSIFSALMIVPFFILDWENNLRLISDRYQHMGNFSSVMKLILTWKPYLFLIILTFFPTMFEYKITKSKSNIFITQILITFSVILIATLFKAMWALDLTGIPSMIYLILIAVVSDVFGFFGGKFLGKKLFKGKKMAPKISPKKTWAGFVSGFVLSVIWASFYGYFMHIWKEMEVNEIFMSITAAIALSLLSPMGDLFFSWIKRRNNKKDFSNLIPGHGGILDRVDALSAIVFFSSMIWLLGK